MTCIFTTINAFFSWVMSWDATMVSAIASGISAAVALIALAVTAVYNWKSFSLRRSEHCFESARRLISNLTTEILSLSSQELSPNYDSAMKRMLYKTGLNFLKLQNLIRGVRDEYLLSCLEVDRINSIENMKYLISGLQPVSSAEEEKAIMLIAKFAYEPNIIAFCSEQPLPPKLQQKALRDFQQDVPEGGIDWQETTRSVLREVFCNTKR